MDLHEELFIESFVDPIKRERYLSFLTNNKRRKKLLDVLDHFRDLNKTKAIAIPPNQQNTIDILHLLQRKGAPEDCHVISTCSDLDGKGLPLVEALEQIVGSGYGSYISCNAGKLGYYEGEEPGYRCILVAK